MANDFVDALRQFNQDLSGLAISRATREASDQVKQIQMSEEDEFKKRSALSQLGSNLALQLSSFGANPQQIQQSVGAITPQQMSSPQDYFAASQAATTPEAKQQYAQAGQGMQAQLASAPLTRYQDESLRLQKYALLGQQAAAGKFDDGKDMTLSDRKTIETLATKQGGKISISNNLQTLVDQWPTLSESERLQQGREILKTINSPEGADAVGVEEARRLGSKLEFALGNFTNSNPTQFGRDLEGFYGDLQNTTKRLQKSLERNDLVISKIYKKYGKDVPVMSQNPDTAQSELDAIQSEWTNMTPEQQLLYIQLREAKKKGK